MARQRVKTPTAGATEPKDLVHLSHVVDNLSVAPFVAETAAANGKDERTVRRDSERYCSFPMRAFRQN